jgi:hypothetical protein
MQIATMFFVGSAAALVAAAPALAKNSESHRTDDKLEFSSCHAYQQAPDGSWTQLPCQESGNGQTQHRTAPKNVESGGEERR